MRKKLISCLLIAVFLVSFTYVACQPEPAAAAVASSVSDARNKLEENRKEQQRLENELKSLSANKADYMDQKSVIDRQVNALQEQVRAYETIINDLTAEIDALQKQLDEAQAVYDENIDRYRAQVRATYERGQVSYLEVLLGSKSFSDFLLRMDYVKQVSAHEKTLLDTIRNSMRTISEDQKAIEANRAEQQESLNALSERKAEVETKQAEIAAIIARIQSSEAEMKKLHEKEEREEAALNAYIEKQLSNTQSSVSYQTGEWIWPVAKASYNYVSSGYGWRTLFGRRDFHYAIDIAAPNGTAIFAAKSGVVKSAGWVTTGGGWQVVIDHGGSYYTYYNHMNGRPPVSAGQSVKQGQVIGYVGMTGTATGNHLDFKIYYNGKAQNPLNYVHNPY